MKSEQYVKIVIITGTRIIDGGEVTSGPERELDSFVLALPAHNMQGATTQLISQRLVNLSNEAADEAAKAAK